MEGFGSERDRRQHAVGRVREGGVEVAAAAGEVGRSRQWLHKWLTRFDTAGPAGLETCSRAPHRRPTVTPSEVTRRVLEVRDRLEAHPFANRGAEAIRFEMITAGDETVPSEATIERILTRAGRSRHRSRSSASSQPRPVPAVTRPGVFQQIDWVGPRWLARQVRFSSLHLVDVGGGGAAAAQYPNELLGHTPQFLTEIAWPALSIPLHLQTDGAFIAQPPRSLPTPFNPFVRCCLFFGVEVIIAPPNELGWQNWVESFNGLWQDRTIRRHPYHTVDDVKHDSDRFIDYYLWHKPHPRLHAHIHSTRFPGQLIDNHHQQLRFPPDGFTVADHTDRNGHLHIPLARGRLTYLRRVQPGGVIEISRSHYPVPASTVGHVVSATVHTASRRLIIRHAHETIATYPFPVPSRTISPYHPPATRGLYHNITE